MYIHIYIYIHINIEIDVNYVCICISTISIRCVIKLYVVRLLHGRTAVLATRRDDSFDGVVSQDICPLPCVCVYKYIYIYIERERYAHIYTHTCIVALIAQWLVRELRWRRPWVQVLPKRSEVIRLRPNDVLSGLEVSPLKVSGGSPVHLRSRHQVLVGKTRWVKNKRKEIYIHIHAYIYRYIVIHMHIHMYNIL